MVIAFLYLLFVVISAPILFVVLTYRSRKSQNHPHALGGLIAGIISAIALSGFGALWWYLNYPQDLKIKNLLLFCLAPGFVIGASLYGIVVKIIRLAQGGGYG